jgi:hypothetical protein
LVWGGGDWKYWGCGNYYYYQTTEGITFNIDIRVFWEADIAWF